MHKTAGFSHYLYIVEQQNIEESTSQTRYVAWIELSDGRKPRIWARLALRVVRLSNRVK